jgi:hypothetical protein
MFWTVKGDVVPCGICIGAKFVEELEGTVTVAFGVGESWIVTSPGGG